MDDEVVGIGIGCHSIGYFLHPDKLTNFSQMGGEGAPRSGDGEVQLDADGNPIQRGLRQKHR